MKHIAVQKGLTPVFNCLKESGYKVSEFTIEQKASKDFLDGFDAVVITGIDDNVTGIQTTNSNRLFIEARGMAPEDVLAVIRKKV